MSSETEQDRLDEQLSSLVDGELNSEEQAFVLRRIGHDRQARERLARYFLVGDALRRQLPAYYDLDLAQRVHEGLLQEPAHKQRRKSLLSWQRSVLGGALAASVALISVLWWQADVFYPGSRLDSHQQPQTAVPEAVVDTAPEKQSPSGSDPWSADNRATGNGAGVMPVGVGVNFTESWQDLQRAEGRGQEVQQVNSRQRGSLSSEANHYPSIPGPVPGRDRRAPESAQGVETQRARVP